MPIVIPNRISIHLKAKELFTLHSGCHGNIVTKTIRYVTNVYCPKEAYTEGGFPLFAENTSSKLASTR